MLVSAKFIDADSADYYDYRGFQIMFVEDTRELQ